MLVRAPGLRRHALEIWVKLTHMGVARPGGRGCGALLDNARNDECWHSGGRPDGRRQSGRRWLAEPGSCL